MVISDWGIGVRIYGLEDYVFTANCALALCNEKFYLLFPYFNKITIVVVERGLPYEL